MAKGLNRRMDAAEGGKGPKTLSYLKVHRSADGNFNVSHHYEESGMGGIGVGYHEPKRHAFADGEDMISHVRKAMGIQRAKDEREEEDEYDAQGGDENER